MVRRTPKRLSQRSVVRSRKSQLAKIDYVEIVDWNTLEPVDSTEGEILTAMAVYIGKTRLIDNFIK